MRGHIRDEGNRAELVVLATVWASHASSQIEHSTCRKREAGSVPMKSSQRGIGKPQVEAIRAPKSDERGFDRQSIIRTQKER